MPRSTRDGSPRRRSQVIGLGLRGRERVRDEDAIAFELGRARERARARCRCDAERDFDHATLLSIARCIDWLARRVAWTVAADLIRVMVRCLVPRRGSSSTCVVVGILGDRLIDQALGLVVDGRGARAPRPASTPGTSRPSSARGRPRGRMLEELVPAMVRRLAIRDHHVAEQLAVARRHAHCLPAVMSRSLSCASTAPASTRSPGSRGSEWPQILSI